MKVITNLLYIRIQEKEVKRDSVSRLTTFGQFSKLEGNKSRGRVILHGLLDFHLVANLMLCLKS